MIHFPENKVSFYSLIRTHTHDLHLIHLLDIMKLHHIQYHHFRTPSYTITYPMKGCTCGISMHMAVLWLAGFRTVSESTGVTHIAITMWYALHSLKSTHLHYKRPKTSIWYLAKKSETSTWILRSRKIYILPFNNNLPKCLPTTIGVVSKTAENLTGSSSSSSTLSARTKCHHCLSTRKWWWWWWWWIDSRR